MKNNVNERKDLRKKRVRTADQKEEVGLLGGENTNNWDSKIRGKGDVQNLLYWFEPKMKEMTERNSEKGVTVEFQGKKHKFEVEKSKTASSSGNHEYVQGEKAKKISTVKRPPDGRRDEGSSISNLVRKRKLDWSRNDYH